MQDIYEVFSGSSIDASFIKSYLEDNGIGCIVNNLLENSIGAGWVDPNSGQGSTISVSAENYEKAEKLVRVYLDSRESE